MSGSPNATLPLFQESANSVAPMAFVNSAA